MTFCSIKYSCTNWGECINGIQTRACTIPKGKCTPTQETNLNQACTNTNSIPTTGNAMQQPSTSSTSSSVTPESTISALKPSLLPTWSWIIIIIFSVVKHTKKSHYSHKVKYY